MQANKTQPTSDSVANYLSHITNESMRADAQELTQLMQSATGAEAQMWGTSIVGFGKNHYVYESGREGDTVAVGFAARKNALVLYSILFYDENEANVSLAGKLGTYTRGKGCMYIKKLADIDKEILKQMVANAYKHRNNS